MSEAGRPGPGTDGQVPRFWGALGLPGIIDLHVHFMPERVLAKVRAYFDAAEANLGVAWPLHYREDEPARLSQLAALGVRAFPSLIYPHKPGMAEWLNGWAADFAARTPGCLDTATFFPEPTAAAYVRASLEDGAQVFKAHLQVGGYDPRDPLLDEAWGLLAEAAVPVVTHCGNGPQPGRFTGPGPIGEVLRRHPDLTLVVAHLGMPEYAEHLDLAARYRNVHLDTTMALTDFTEVLMPLSRDLLPRLADLGDRIVFGSDFPNIPYPYAHQVAVLARLGLGDGWLRAVLWDNASRLLGRARSR